ncbi:class I SAM-dependent methyltransferase [Arachnia propionica]|uniref:Class I SAM-dependent methyltransferase n=1 Tax=Arachnia propionica TaxID=1750 RepID=A0A3P1T4W0_9ACTN|nr:class I SAM-dependent methyltransferase [Arachnia propionica]RRD04409.1 class I SAM-dependent methyltransferase [Arachnia propionica]
MGTGWSGGAAEAYDVSFARLCAGATPAILDALPTGGGRRLLDVGAGTGRLSVRAAARGWRVTALEPDADMLEVARRRGVDSAVTWAAGATPGMAFPDRTFDHAVASFVINHVASPRRALRDIARVVTPGGRIVATIWESSLGDLDLLWRAATSVPGFTAPPVQHLPPEEDFERSPDGLAGLAGECGLEVGSAGVVFWEFVIDPVDLWQGPAHGIAGIGRAHLAQEATVRERMWQAYRDAAATIARDGVLHLMSYAVLVEAVVPDGWN